MNIDINQILTLEATMGEPNALSPLREQLKPFNELMMQHRCALKEIETKLNVLNDEFTTVYERNPIQTIKTRIKRPFSIIEKLRSRGIVPTIPNMESELNDIAGIRVVCCFTEDIYKLAKMLSEQDDIHLIEEKDYIKNPKENGYRSLHLILTVPIFLSNETKSMKVEVQFRTIAMDFWASLDHQLKYKKNLDNPAIIAEELKNCADIIAETDNRMQEIRNMIERTL